MRTQGPRLQRWLTGGLVALLALIVVTMPAGRPRAGSQQASCNPAVASPVGSPASSAPATPVGSPPGATPISSPPSLGLSPTSTPLNRFQSASAEVTEEIGSFFRCLDAGDWDETRRLALAGSPGERLVLTLERLAKSGRFTVDAELLDVGVRSSGNGFASTDVTWRLGRQIRGERWTLQQDNGQWRVDGIRAGLSSFDQVTVGITGSVTETGPALSRTRLTSPGAVELRFDIATTVLGNQFLVIHRSDLCAGDARGLLVASASAADSPAVILLSEIEPTVYRIALVNEDFLGDPAASCSAPAVELTIQP